MPIIKTINHQINKIINHKNMHYSFEQSIKFNRSFENIDFQYKLFALLVPNKLDKQKIGIKTESSNC